MNLLKGFGHASLGLGLWLAWCSDADGYVFSMAVMVAVCAYLVREILREEAP